MSKLSDWHRLFKKSVENFAPKNFKMRLFSLKPITKKLKNKIKNKFYFFILFFNFFVIGFREKSHILKFFRSKMLYTF